MLMEVRGRPFARRSAGKAAGAPAAQAVRARRAMLIMGALALAVITLSVLEHLLPAGVFGSGPQAGSGEAESYVAQAWRGAVEGEDLDRTIGQSEAILVGEEGVPDWFADELFAPGEFEVVASTSDWAVVWLESRHAPEEALRLLAEELADAGWAGYESGLENQVTFAKEGGSCQWAMATCTQGEEGSDVVLRLWRAP